MKQIMAITKALADQNRVRALMMLQHNELCVCQLIEMLALAPSTVSKHMSILQQADLVESRKDGRWIYYRLPGRGSDKRVKDVLKWLRNHLSEDDQIIADASRIASVCCMPKEKLCEHYKG